MVPTPVVRSIPFRDPVAAFAPFAGAPVSALLDSAAPGDPRSRYSYIAAQPFQVLRVARPEAAGDDGIDPFGALGRALARFRLKSVRDAPPFQTGAVGYLGYELGGRLERLPPPRAAGVRLPDMVIGFYDAIAAFDVAARRAWVISSGFPETDPAARAVRAIARADALARRIAAAPDLAAPDLSPAAARRARWRAEMTRKTYEQKVARIIDYIRAGDIFQANMTQRFLAELPANVAPFDLYRRLRALSPAPFSAYLCCEEGKAIASVSPELYLAVDGDGRIETRPIKGTRPRGANPAEDRALATELEASEKDRAENLMIVDLLRNDLSRVSRFGSVKVPVLCGLESFANVHHLVSAVEGRLIAGRNLVDLLRAAFPGGSITGAPKIRAMEIIAELEPARRGPYCGSIAWFGFDGGMGSSIVIRTLVIDGRTVVAQAGGGIVADSDPAREYEESLDKARPLLQSLDPAGSGSP